MAVKIEKSTIIGDVLDMAPQSAPPVHGNRHALPGLPFVQRGNRGGSLRSTRRRRRCVFSTGQPLLGSV